MRQKIHTSEPLCYIHQASDIVHRPNREYLSFRLHLPLISTAATPLFFRPSVSLRRFCASLICQTSHRRTEQVSNQWQRFCPFPAILPFYHKACRPFCSRLHMLANVIATGILFFACSQSVFRQDLPAVLFRAACHLFPLLCHCLILPALQDFHNNL